MGDGPSVAGTQRPSSSGWSRIGCSDGGRKRARDRHGVGGHAIQRLDPAPANGPRRIPAAAFPAARDFGASAARSSSWAQRSTKVLAFGPFRERLAMVDLRRSAYCSVDPFHRSSLGASCLARAVTHVAALIRLLAIILSPTPSSGGTRSSAATAPRAEAHRILREQSV